MEGCEASLIDASKMILFSAGQGGWGSVVSKIPHPIPFHSIPGYYPSMAFSHHHHIPKQKHPVLPLKRTSTPSSFVPQPTLLHPSV